MVNMMWMDSVWTPHRINCTNSVQLGHPNSPNRITVWWEGTGGTRVWISADIPRTMSNPEPPPFELVLCGGTVYVHSGYATAVSTVDGRRVWGELVQSGWIQMAWGVHPPPRC